MDFKFNDTQQMLIDTAARLMREHSGVEYWRKRRALADGCDPELWGKFAELGWLALAVPEDAGGLGGSLEDIALLMAELGRGLATDPIASSAVLAAHVIDQLASGQLRDQLLGEIAAGTSRIALAHNEAGDRYELSKPRATVARRTGDSYQLSGVKVMALDAPSAHRLLVTADLEGEAGYGIFLVPVESPGLTMTAYPLVDGSRAADLELAAVELPASALLGDGSKAVTVLAEAVVRVTVALVAQAVGAMEAAVGVASDYAKERKQFGQPIGKFQAIAHLATDMFVQAYQARSALYQLLSYAEGTDKDRDRAVSMSKILIADAAKTIGHNGIQIHGGYGMTDEYAISHYYRRLFSLDRQYGDGAFHLAALAKMGPAEPYDD
jgi:alkylation response protein AidB-like acyl-CoA dehydrogenase